MDKNLVSELLTDWVNARLNVISERSINFFWDVSDLKEKAIERAIALGLDKWSEENQEIWKPE